MIQSKFGRHYCTLKDTPCRILNHQILQTSNDQHVGHSNPFPLVPFRQVKNIVKLALHFTPTTRNLDTQHSRHDILHEIIVIVLFQIRRIRMQIHHAKIDQYIECALFQIHITIFLLQHLLLIDRFRLILCLSNILGRSYITPIDTHGIVCVLGHFLLLHNIAFRHHLRLFNLFQPSLLLLLLLQLRHLLLLPLPLLPLFSLPLFTFHLLRLGSYPSIHINLLLLPHLLRLGNIL
mmetsp:Transcript_20241/g.44015  ORF Transcript_20241/g.44015 Transcript_20241/m.44015 type:complete len:235 (-) Transcript_20241:1081-1785(-)